MSSFKRSLFGYSRPQVDAAIKSKDAQINGLVGDLERERALGADVEAEMASLSGMVIERERQIRELNLRLQEANECHARSISSLDAVTERLEELQAQARGQATRIRMKALREAVEVSQRVQALTEAADEDALVPSSNGNGEANGKAIAAPREDFDGLYEGQVKLEIGPLGDFSQLVG
ncbi:MAG: hypothetical protein AB7T48_05090, partial [Solirubrobacterales bacterium]